MTKDKNVNGNKKSSNKKRVIGITVAIIVVVIILLLSSGYFAVEHYLGKINRVKINQNDLGINSSVDANLSKFTGIHNIYLFGVDEPEGVPGRSDAIMVMSVNDTDHTLKLVSILRDSLVNIPGHGMGKINSAIYYGGPQLAMKTLNEDYHLNIHNFISVNFTTLPEIINSLGGIQVNLTADEVKAIQSPYDQLKTLDHMPDAPPINKTGPQTLDGIQTMAYLRIRHNTGGDYARTFRQRTVIEQLFQKVKSTSVSEYPELLNKIAPALETNMTDAEIWQFGEEILATGSSSITEARVPVDSNCIGKTINGFWFLTFNQDETNQNLYNFIYENKPLPNQEYQ
ncbi:MAG: LCP family protein [Sarcina sp.]